MKTTATKTVAQIRRDYTAAEDHLESIQATSREIRRIVSNVPVDVYEQCVSILKEIEKQLGTINDMINTNQAKEEVGQ